MVRATAVLFVTLLFVLAVTGPASARTASATFVAGAGDVFCLQDPVKPYLQPAIPGGIVDQFVEDPGQIVNPKPPVTLPYVPLQEGTLAAINPFIRSINQQIYFVNENITRPLWAGPSFLGVFRGIAPTINSLAPTVLDEFRRYVPKDVLSTGSPDTAAEVREERNLGCILFPTRPGETTVQVTATATTQVSAAGQKLSPAVPGNLKVGFFVCQDLNRDGQCGSPDLAAFGCGAGTFKIVGGFDLYVYLDEALGPVHCIPPAGGAPTGGPAIFGTIEANFQ